MSSGTYMQIHWKALLIFFSLILLRQPSAESATLRGRLYLAQDQMGKPIEVVLKQGRRVIARGVPDEANNYEFKDLANGRYELVVRMKKREVKRRIELCCGPDSISVIDINLDENDTDITIHFPIEDRDIVDIVELRRDYPDDVLKEYEKAQSILEMLGIWKGRLAFVQLPAFDGYQFVSQVTKLMTEVEQPQVPRRAGIASTRHV